MQCNNHLPETDSRGIDKMSRGRRQHDHALRGRRINSDTHTR